MSNASNNAADAAKANTTETTTAAASHIDGLPNTATSDLHADDANKSNKSAVTNGTAGDDDTDAAAAPAHNHCGLCGEPATLQCAGCHNIKYCNKQCQKKDW